MISYAPVLRLRQIAIALLTVGLFCSAPVVANEPDNAVDVTIGSTPEGIRARFELKHPTKELKLEYADPELQQKLWTVPSGFVLSDGTVRRVDDQPFRSFEVTVRPGETVAAPVYPALVNLGPAGRVLYGAYFVGNKTQFETTIHVAPADSEMVLGTPGNQRDWRVQTVNPKRGRAGDRYVFLGPRGYMAANGGQIFVVAPDVPRWLSREVMSSASAAISFYGKKLNIGLPTHPLVFIAMEPDVDDKGAQGDVTEGEIISLRFFGKEWVATTAWQLSSARQLLRHETVHLWNSSLFGLADRNRSSWLHEGAAEYWAELSGPSSKNENTMHLIEKLNQCMNAVGTGTIPAPVQRGDGISYQCGEVMQWVVDIAFRHESADHTNTFILWRKLFDQADNNGGIYTANQFRTLAEQSALAKALLHRFFDETGIQRWNELRDDLSRLGIDLTTVAQSDKSLRRQVIKHLLRLACGDKTQGLYTKEATIKLDTGDRCGELSGDPEINAIDGRKLFGEMPLAYESVATHCRAQQNVELLLVDGKTIRFTCTAPLPELPPQFAITAKPTGSVMAPTN